MYVLLIFIIVFMSQVTCKIFLGISWAVTLLLLSYFGKEGGIYFLSIGTAPGFKFSWFCPRELIDGFYENLKLFSSIMESLSIF